VSEPEAAAFAESIALEDLERDPYPIYARLRKEAPVAFVPAVGLWLVTRWQDVNHVDHHPELFTAATDPSTLNRTMGVNMLGSEGEAHRRIRSVVEGPFRPREVEARSGGPGGRIPSMARQLVEGFVAGGRADLLTAFCEPFSVRSLRFMLGLEDVPVEDLARWNAGIMVGLSNFEGNPEKDAVGASAAAEARAAIDPILDRLERGPDGSVLATMLHAEPDGGPLSREEIVANTLLMLSGGLQEPRDLIALTVWALLSHPDQLGDVVADGSLMRAAIEETLRCYAPVGTSTRQTTEPLTLAGVELPAGALIGAVLSSANRDERRFKEPERFDIHRPRGTHVAFATGNHFCLGAWLGRHQCRTAVEALLEMLPGLRLDPEHPVQIRGWEFRAPTSLHVLWDVND
jgi:cytochrome P450